MIIKSMEETDPFKVRFERELINNYFERSVISI